jgi:hypothetical protein
MEITGHKCLLENNRSDSSLISTVQKVWGICPHTFFENKLAEKEEAD